MASSTSSKRVGHGPRERRLEGVVSLAHSARPWRRTPPAISGSRSLPGPASPIRRTSAAQPVAGDRATRASHGVRGRGPVGGRSRSGTCAGRTASQPLLGAVPRARPAAPRLPAKRNHLDNFGTPPAEARDGDLGERKAEPAEHKHGTANRRPHDATLPAGPLSQLVSVPALAGSFPARLIAASAIRPNRDAFAKPRSGPTFWADCAQATVIRVSAPSSWANQRGAGS